ncbi:MAG: alcohol dehydrogenase [Rhizobiales bacterium]|nr:alcohol dehydrogenase [Hyphomicrobiales bacterium]MBA68555.1 alcohol dehydrogenase [Hyphomicrobiales bacterium]
MRELPVAELGAGRLRVAMSLVPVNPSDLIPMTGAYAHRIRLPAIAGYEGVGRVIAAGAGGSSLIGRRVLPLHGEGTWQTLVECNARHAVPVPDDVPDVLAARGYINPLAALIMLRLWPVKGRTVLLSGAGSSCADYLGFWALRQGAERVIGLHRSENRIARLKALGIEPVPLTDQVRIDRAARQADVTFDAIGGPVASRILGMMGEGASFVGYGLLSGEPVVAPPDLRAAFKRFHLRDHLAHLPDRDWAASFDDLWPLLRTMTLPEVHIHRFTEWRRALAEVGKRGARKPILDFSEAG